MNPMRSLSAATTQISGWSPTARWRNYIGPARSRRCMTSGSATGAADQPDATRHVRAERIARPERRARRHGDNRRHIPISLLQLAETMKNSDTNNLPDDLRSDRRWI